jgi:osmotically-inducible protein OsmY
MDMGQHRLLLFAACVVAPVASGEAQQPATSTAAISPEAEARRNVSDAQLGLEVQVQLFQELNVSNLSSIVRHGVATLDGVVNSEGDRQRAEQIALSVPGVTNVVNELRVADATIVALTNDAAALAERETTRIETAVSERLSSDATLGSRSIVVEADDLTNTVTLSGTVSTEEEKERAGQLAVSAFPAGQVRNQLEVRQRL